MGVGQAKEEERENFATLECRKNHARNGKKKTYKYVFFPLAYSPVRNNVNFENLTKFERT